MSDFTPWEGGEMPVEADARVFVRYRDGIESKVWIAGDLRWAHAGLNDDIVAYREVRDV